MTLIRIVCLAAGNEASGLEGQYLKSYDPDGHQGRGEVVGTPERGEALHFADAGAAIECWRKTSKVRPLRPDGRPNRPLTAYTVEFLP